MGFFGEFWSYMKVRKKFWLLPVFMVMILLGGLLDQDPGADRGVLGAREPERAPSGGAGSGQFPQPQPVSAWQPPPAPTITGPTQGTAVAPFIYTLF